MVRSRGAVAATLAAGLLWGSSFTVIKVGLQSVDPYWFAFLRFLLASAVALPLAALAGEIGKVRALLKDPLVILLGASNALGFILQFKGQTLTTAGKAALLVNASAVPVAVASHFIFKERFGLPKLSAVIVGMAGLLLVTTGGRLTVAGGGELAGDLLIISAMAAWTLFILIDKKLVTERSTSIPALTAAMVTVTAVAALPAPLVLGRGAFPQLTMGWVAIAYTAVFCTIIPFLLWTWGLRYISATVSCIILLVEIIFALGLAAAFLGERPGAATLTGGLLILGAIGLISAGKRDQAPDRSTSAGKRDQAPKSTGAIE